MAKDTVFPDYGSMVRAQPPVLQTVGQGARGVVDSATNAASAVEAKRVAGLRVAGELANQAPKLAGVPAAGMANAVSKGLASLQTGYTGDTYKPQQFEGKTLRQLMGTPPAPAAAGSRVPGPLPALNAAPPLSELNALPGLEAQKSFAGAQVVDTKFAQPAQKWVADTDSGLAKFRQAQMSQDGTAAPAGATSINVSRQPNGVMSFSGQGGGPGVQYTGLPTWTSTQGGAGQGGIGYAEPAAGDSNANARMAKALQDIRFSTALDDIRDGVGGSVGVAQNKIQLGELNDRMRNDANNETLRANAGLSAATQQRGQDLGLQADMARVQASVYGTDVGAKTAVQQVEVDKQKAAAAIQVAREKAAAGKPTSAKDQAALFVFSGKNPDGTVRTPAEQAALETRYATTFGNRDSYMGMMQGEEP